jgi:hypothetical protein
LTKSKNSKPEQHLLKLNEAGEIDATTAFHLGYNASVIGIIKSRNPFPQNSENYEWWRRGWECKFYGEDPTEALPEDDLTLGVK